MPTDTKPHPCPRCGKPPVLVLDAVWNPHSSRMYDWDIYRYECRKWFGFRFCFRGPVHRVEHGISSMWGKRGASRKWNQAADAVNGVSPEPSDDFESLLDWLGTD